jgi:hypothetical protein
MSRLDDRRLARQLRPESRPEPPAELLEALRGDIPEVLPRPVAAGGDKVLPFRWRSGARRLVLAAASVVTIVGGAAIAWRVVQQAPSLSPEMRDEAVTAARKPASPRTPAAAELESGQAVAPDVAAEVRSLGYLGDAQAPPPVPSASGRERPAAPSLGERADAEAAAAPGFETELAAREQGEADIAAPAPREATRRPDEPDAETDSSADRVTAAESPGANLGAAAAAPRQSGEARPSRHEPAEPQQVRRRQPAVPPAADERAATGAAQELTLEAAPMPPPPPAPPSPQPPAARRAPAAGAVAPPEGRRETPAPEAFAVPAPAPGTTSAQADPRGGGPRGAPSTFVDTAERHLSPLDLHVGSGAYQAVARALREGRWPPAAAVHVDELLGAFDYGDRAPGGEVALAVEGGPSPWAGGERRQLVRVGVATGRARGPVGTLVAAEARAEVELDPHFVRRWRLIGFERAGVVTGSAVDAAAGANLAAGEAVTAVYEVELRPGVPSGAAVATLEVQWRAPGEERFREVQRVLRAGDLAPTWEQASRSLRLAAVVARFAELLRGARQEPSADFAALAAAVDALAREWPEQPRVAELADLIRRARALRPSDG